MKKTKKVKGSSASTCKNRHVGTHIIAEFWGGNTIESVGEIKKVLLEATRVSKNTPLGIKIHKFKPMGLTAFILLAESHISIHTWPEIKYVAIDIFSCGKDAEPMKGLDYLKKVFSPDKVKVKIISRG